MTTKNIVPNNTNEGSLGVANKVWGSAFIKDLTVTGNLMGNVTSKGIIDVASYGAMGNANYFNVADNKFYVDAGFSVLSHDDSDSIISAIADAMAKGYTTIIFPMSSYWISKQINILKPNIIIKGNGSLGMDGTIKSTFSGITFNCFPDINDGSYGKIYFEDITLIGYGNATLTGTGISLTNVHSTTQKNIHIINFRTNILLSSSYLNTFISLQSSNSNDGDIGVKSILANNNTFIGGWMYKSCMKFDTGNCTVIGMDFEPGTASNEFDNSTLINCRFERITNTFKGFEYLILNSNCNVIGGNFVWDTSSWPDPCLIRVKGSNNKINTNFLYSHNLIFLDRTSKNNEISLLSKHISVSSSTYEYSTPILDLGINNKITYRDETNGETIDYGITSDSVTTVVGNFSKTNLVNRSALAPQNLTRTDGSIEVVDPVGLFKGDKFVVNGTSGAVRSYSNPQILIADGTKIYATSAYLFIPSANPVTSITVGSVLGQGTTITDLPKNRWFRIIFFAQPKSGVELRFNATVNNPVIGQTFYMAYPNIFIGSNPGIPTESLVFSGGDFKLNPSIKAKTYNPITTTADISATRKIAVEINGETLYILATT